MAWRATPAARAFSCRLGREVATRSMREQLSFDHARPKELNITWWPMTIIKEHGNSECIPKGEAANATGASAARLELALAVVADELLNASSGNRRVRRVGRGGAEGRAAGLGGGAKGALLLSSERVEGISQAAAAAVTLRSELPPQPQSLSLPPQPQSLSLPQQSQPLSLPQLTSSADAQPLHISRQELRHAVCVTGLRRSFSEISANLRSRVYGVLQSTAPKVEIRIFGVQPHNDSWGEVLEKLGPFEAVEKQASCRTKAQRLPAFFTCTRGRVVHRMDSCTASFVQMQCDLVHCDTMIQTHEVSGVQADSSPVVIRPPDGNPSFVCCNPFAATHGSRPQGSRSHSLSTRRPLSALSTL